MKRCPSSTSAGRAEEFDLALYAGRTERHYWRDLWRFRELFLFLAWRDILVRYKQTVIGVVWALVRPLMTMVVFSVIFGRLAKMPSDGVPYPVLVFAGMLPWQFFASSLVESSNSLVANSNLLTKVYFPRLIVPAGAVVVSLVDFLISFAILGCLMLFFGMTVGWKLLVLLPLLVLAFSTSLGVGLWMAALNVKYRDFRYVIPFLVQFGLYISPVGFSSSVVPEHLRVWYSLNPMVGVIDGFRWAITGSAAAFYLPGFLISVVLSIVLLVSGILFFRRMERTFADVI